LAGLITLTYNDTLLRAQNLHRYLAETFASPLPSGYPHGIHLSADLLVDTPFAVDISNETGVW
jgi:hypothetical protein